MFVVTLSTPCVGSMVSREFIRPLWVCYEDVVYYQMTSNSRNDPAASGCATSRSIGTSP